MIGAVVSTSDEGAVAGRSDVDSILIEGPGAPSGSGARSAYWSYDKPIVRMFLMPGDDEQEEMLNDVRNGIHPGTVIRGEVADGTSADISEIRSLMGSGWPR